MSTELISGSEMGNAVKSGDIKRLGRLQLDWVASWSWGFCDANHDLLLSEPLTRRQSGDAVARGCRVGAGG